ncbi:hypothetical protein VIGAN_05136800 [Vigna angularis var. angularis]|uniref:Uncharacterized protein n=1 Tax=Vigna angularis var. angularis TaxID=157739 RepID=A0A0S3S521_PHAAN|nr:hypothetical protein VIGAN_05136800 [Vigna angularis var. angularis]
MAWLRREEKEGGDGRVREVKVVQVEVEVRSGMRIEWFLERTRHCSTPPPSFKRLVVSYSVQTVNVRSR